MADNWPLAFLEFFVVIAFGIVWLVTEQVAKRAAKKYGPPETKSDGDHEIVRRVRRSRGP